ncbi:MAG: DUF6644 family protein [Xanthobacteraceae bacterium]
MTGAIIGDFAKWLGATALSHTIQTVGWVIPALQTIHILAIAVLFFSAVIVDLRLWRALQRDVPLKDVARRFLPVIWPVLLILLLTGSLLIVGEPRRSLLNTTFYLKMTLLAFAVVLTIALQWSLSSAPEFWEQDRGRQIAARFAATLSILVWCCIIFAGRWIAYTQVG